MLAPVPNTNDLDPLPGFYETMRFFETLPPSAWVSRAQARAIKQRQRPPAFQGKRERERRLLRLVLGKVDKAQCSPAALELWGTMEPDA